MSDGPIDTNDCAEIVERSWQAAIATVSLVALKQTILFSVDCVS